VCVYVKSFFCLRRLYIRVYIVKYFNTYMPIIIISIKYEYEY